MVSPSKLGAVSKVTQPMAKFGKGAKDKIIQDAGEILSYPYTADMVSKLSETQKLDRKLTNIAAEE